MTQAFVKGLEDNTRQAMQSLLNERLADGIAMAQAVKQAHWTVKGPGFIGFHELLDDVADRLRDGNDLMAERCTILGGQPRGTVEAAAKGSSLDAYPTEMEDISEHVEALKEHMMAYGAKIRSAIEQASEAGDADTEDLFTEVSRVVDKDAWFIGAHGTRG